MNTASATTEPATDRWAILYRVRNSRLTSNGRLRVAVDTFAWPIETDNIDVATMIADAFRGRVVPAHRARRMNERHMRRIHRRYG